MLFTRLIVVLFLGLALSACGMFRNNKEYAYLNAQSTKALEIPEGMTAPKSTQPLEVPDIKVNTLDLTNDLVEPPVIVKSVDLSELEDETSKTDVSADASKDQPQATEQPELVALTSTQLITPEGDSTLLVDAGFDQVWPAVSPALVELGFTIDDSNRGGQIYTISKELVSVNIEEEVHPGDEKPPLKEEYQIHFKQVGEKTQITVHNKYGELERSGLSDHLLLQIQEILGNPVNKNSNNN